jgi:predicted nuclease with RNAse H fold
VNCVVGIDLAGVKHQKTGFAILHGLEARTIILHSDKSIVKAVEAAKPLIASIDAPLSKPTKGYMRVCEKQLKKMKIAVFPCMFTQMAKLTERGIKIAELLRKKGHLIIESYPGAAQDLLGIPRKGKSLTALQNGLVKISFYRERLLDLFII